MGDHVGEWARVDAAASRTRSEDDGIGSARHQDFRASVAWDERAIATQGRVRAVKDGRVTG
jgi:hypothetical protein